MLLFKATFVCPVKIIERGITKSDNNSSLLDIVFVVTTINRSSFIRENKRRKTQNNTFLYKI